jgi:hypothetical protein
MDTFISPRKKYSLVLYCGLYRSMLAVRSCSNPAQSTFQVLLLNISRRELMTMKEGQQYKLKTVDCAGSEGKH